MAFRFSQPAYLSELLSSYGPSCLKSGFKSLQNVPISKLKMAQHNQHFEYQDLNCEKIYLNM